VIDLITGLLFALRSSSERAGKRCRERDIIAPRATNNAAHQLHRH
jgi:hypothetical protein